MLFFNIDLHVSVISDIADIFKKLGHQVDDWSLSGHYWVMNRTKVNISLGDGTNLTCGGVCSDEICEKFYNTHKDEFEKYDGFIACYPVEFAMLYEKWNKPIIIVNCIRYEHPTNFGSKLHKRLDEFLKKWNEKKLLWYVCNNKGDQWYTEYFTGIKSMHIPNLCEYTNCKYTGNKNTFLIHTGSHIENIKSNCMSVDAVRNDEYRYKWEDIYDYAGFIHNPYHNGSMSIFEHYTANIPMFFPSKKFMKQLFYENKSLQQLTFIKIHKREEPEDLNNPLSLRNPDILQKWLDTCDFYDEENMPYIQLFDNWDHMNELLNNVNLKEISNNMCEYNKIRRDRIFNSWTTILNEISTTLNKV